MNFDYVFFCLLLACCCAFFLTSKQCYEGICSCLSDCIIWTNRCNFFLTFIFFILIKDLILFNFIILIHCPGLGLGFNPNKCQISHPQTQRYKIMRGVRTALFLWDLSIIGKLQIQIHPKSKILKRKIPPISTVRMPTGRAVFLKGTIKPKIKILLTSVPVESQIYPSM